MDYRSVHAKILQLRIEPKIKPKPKLQNFELPHLLPGRNPVLKNPLSPVSLGSSNLDGLSKLREGKSQLTLDLQ